MPITNTSATMTTNKKRKKMYKGINTHPTQISERAIKKLMEEYQEFFHSFQIKDVDERGFVTDFTDNNGLKNHIHYKLFRDYEIDFIRNSFYISNYSYRRLPDNYTWAFKETIRVVDRATKKSHSVVYVYNHDLSKKEETSHDVICKDLREWHNNFLGIDPELEKQQRAEKRKLAEEQRQARIAAGIDPEMNNIIFEDRLEKTYNKLRKMDMNLYGVRTVYKENDNVGYPTIMKRDIQEPLLGNRSGHAIYEGFKTDIEDAISEYISNRDYE